MGRFTVYSKDGQTVRCVLDKLEYTGVFMAERACTSTFISDAKINCKRLSKYIFYSSFSLLTFATKK